MDKGSTSTSDGDFGLDPKKPRIVIVGAGVGGLIFAINIKEKLGHNNFVVLEKGEDVGGTWRANTYPGCTSDVGVAFYSLSSSPSPSFTNTHPPYHEIQKYWKELCSSEKKGDMNVKKTYGIEDKLHFGIEVVGATWVDEKKLWEIQYQRVSTSSSTPSTIYTIESEILILALGILSNPHIPLPSEIKGVDKFKGRMFHSSQWPKEKEANWGLSGKRVGVVGNGASATQFVPIIIEDKETKVTQFCRTPNWMMPSKHHPISNFKQSLYKWIPGFLAMERFRGFLMGEFFYFIIFGTRFLHPTIRWLFSKYIKSQAPKELWDKLIPDYTLGCKRVIFDTNYLKSLHEPNITLNWDGIQEVVEDGIITKKGEKVELDVIIWSTGYITDEVQIPIKGLTQTITEFYKSQEGPMAYYGSTLPGFPNLFLPAGPNTATGHTSVILFEEIQAGYFVKLLKPLIESSKNTKKGKKKIVSFNPKLQPTIDYNKYIHSKLEKSVFTSCASWYRTGAEHEGKITSIFPGAGSLFAWYLRKVRWDDYEVELKEAWDVWRGKA